MPNPKQEHDSNQKEFLDAGFVPEQVGAVTIYKRAVSNDVIEAAIAFCKRQIGYTSRDIPGKKKRRD